MSISSTRTGQLTQLYNGTQTAQPVTLEHYLEYSRVPVSERRGMNRRCPSFGPQAEHEAIAAGGQQVVGALAANRLPEGVQPDGDVPR